MICPECGEEFEKNIHNQLRCSKLCSVRLRGRRHDRRRDQLPERIAAKNATAKRWRLRKIAEGMCSKCGKFVPADGNRVCSLCIEASIAYKG